jgi:hypothetical protein
MATHDRHPDIAHRQMVGKFYSGITISDCAGDRFEDVYGMDHFANSEAQTAEMKLQSTRTRSSTFHFASTVFFNAYHRQRDSRCLPWTRKAALEEIYKWIDGDEKSCIFWLNGWPDTRKSAIARTVARHYHSGGRLAASLFFARSGGDCSHAGVFVTGIARQLADNKVLDMQQSTRSAFEEHSQIVKHTLED